MTASILSFGRHLLVLFLNVYDRILVPFEN